MEGGLFNYEIDNNLKLLIPFLIILELYHMRFEKGILGLDRQPLEVKPPLTPTWNWLCE